MSTTLAEPVVTFASTAEVRTLVKRFEAGVLSKREWHHRAHLTVAAWYLLHLDEREATHKVESGILHFNRLNGIERTRTSGFHETLTLFWVFVARRFLSTLPSDTSFLERVNELVCTYASQNRLFLEYYSPERIWSWEARLRWVEPDLKSLDESGSLKGVVAIEPEGSE